MKRLAIAVGLVLVGLVAWWSMRQPPAGPTAPPPPPRPQLPLPAAVADAPTSSAVVMWAAQAQARFEPCGCVAGMNGGLMRRATLTARLPRERVLSCELGGWSGGSRGHELLRSRYYLRGLSTAGIGVVAIGAAEIGLGSAQLATLLAEAQSLRLPVVSANLDGATGCVPSVAISAGGRRFLVTAVAPTSAAGAGLGVRDPTEAVTAQAAEAARRGLDLVVLADLDPEACTALARAVPQTALIIGGRSEHPSPEPVAVGAVRVLWAGNHGKVLGSWAWGQPVAAFELLHEKLPADPEQRAILGSYQRALAEASFDNGEAGGLRPLASTALAGSATCTACHPDADRIHQASKHRQAFAALERKGYQFDPDCLRCHVTGLGEGGYRRGAAAFAEVGCEACHGPGAAHNAAAKAGRATDAPLPQLSAASCVGCHDPDNSPTFDYQVYWPRILHGR